MKALILAAGGGTNMAPFSNTRPKPMVHVTGRPMLYRTITTLKESGFHEVDLVIGPHGDKITDYFGKGGEMEVSLHYTRQKGSKGIGGAILSAKGRFNPGEHFLLIYGDVVTEDNAISNLRQTFALTNTPTAAITLSTDSGELGNVYLDNAMNITRIVEKPGKKGMGNYVLAGIYVLPYRFFDILKGFKGNMAKALAKLITQDGLKASILEKGWLDIAHPWDILQANRMIMDTWDTSTIHKDIIYRDIKVQGTVHIEEGVVIRPGAFLQGPSYIGRGSYIGNNALIREYTCLGPECSVGYGVELKNCVMFGKSSVGRLSFIGDSVIGENVEIGSGTMTLNGNMNGATVSVKINKKSINTEMKKIGAFIGDDCKLGSGHTVQAGTVIQPGKLLPHHHTYPTKSR
ncbi:MAG: bifunctional sugar-1-phosphate nucleotidylyltransferase/acetyltransferase [Nitrospinota bacterium]